MRYSKGKIDSVASCQENAWVAERHPVQKTGQQAGHGHGCRATGERDSSYTGVEMGLYDRDYMKSKEWQKRHAYRRGNRYGYGKSLQRPGDTVAGLVLTAIFFAMVVVIIGFPIWLAWHCWLSG